MKNILEQYSKEICKQCKNKIKCKEELHVRLDNCVKCDCYEREDVQEIKEANKC